MKSIVTLIAASSLLAALATAQPAPHYTVTDLGTFPKGTFSQANFVSNDGFVTGLSGINSSSTSPQHAVLWYNRGWYKGMITDIGAPGLGGPNSVAYGINASGGAVGQAESSTKDPNGENFCGYGTGLICLPFRWQDAGMTPLPTLGGPNGSANMINNRGQAVGWAENKQTDPACPAPQKFQFKPVFWDANGKIQELPTVSGDPNGAALAINDNGQVVGISGPCAAFDPNIGVNLVDIHAWIWQDGTVTDLGNLGGDGKGGGNHACAINNKGQVVGHSDLAGDATFHAYLWNRATGMQDLGTLPGDAASLAIGINDGGDVVGASLDASFNPRAFVRQNGVMNDLNSLVPSNSPLYLLIAYSINASGEIVGFGATSAGEVHAFLATPTGNAHSASFSPAEQGAFKPIALPENTRRQLFGRLGLRGQ